MSQRKSQAFQFSTDASKIANTELDFASFAGDLIDSLKKEQVLAFIKNEYEVQLAEIDSTLDSLNEDKNAIEAGKEKAQAMYQKLHVLKRKLDEHYQTVKADFDRIKKIKDEQTAKTSVIQNQINDLADVRKTLHEQQTKEAKNIDQKKLDALNKFLATNKDAAMLWILDSMSCMITGEAGTCYDKCKDKIWMNHEKFSDALRIMDNQRMDRKWCEDMMGEICGKNGEGGQHVKELMDPSKFGTYVQFYPFFKTLSKMVYCAMTQRKEIALRRTVSVGGGNEDDLQNQVDAAQGMLDALSVREVVQEEMDRIYEGEQNWLTDKLSKTEDEITKFSAMKDGLLDNYFGSLPQ